MIYHVIVRLFCGENPQAICCIAGTSSPWKQFSRYKIHLGIPNKAKKINRKKPNSHGRTATCKKVFEIFKIVLPHLTIQQMPC